MDEELKTDIAVIKVQMENMNSQMQRFISHLESEQRVSSNISKRVDTLQFTVENLQKDRERSESKGRWRIETIISLMALAATMAMLFIRGN